MAEILATMVVGPLLSMVKEKASSYLLEQYNVMEGMEEQHKVLKRKLPAILDVIADAEMQAAQHREGAKAWLEDVRTVAYQANDVFDEFNYEALRRKAKKEGHYRKIGMHIIKLFPNHNRVVFRYRMGNKLRFILRDMEVLLTEMNAFRFEFRQQKQLSMKWRQTDSIIIDPMKIASRSRALDKQKVVHILLGQGGNVDLTVLPIVGMGGLGKTTLAQLIYNDSKIREHFQLLLWVCVSDNFDVDVLAKTIVEAAAKEKNGTVTKGSLQEVGSGKRYLLVLDDVWNRDASLWERLKSRLQHGGLGSSVLVTTRDKSVARIMGTTEAYVLGVLNQSFIEEIIKTKAFGSNDVSSKNELLEMVGNMAKKCAGSPLAATALGSLLCTKESKKEWEDILSSRTICNEETGILPILKLSYNDLPSQMRQCFAFCAMFPKDYEIERDELIHLWMANGFILEEHPETRGKQMFAELAARSFFQNLKEIPPLVRFRRSEYGYCPRMTCKVHDLMHDVAQSAMGKECATIVTESSKSEDFPYSSRHLFVSAGNDKTVLNRFLDQERAPALQTLFCTGDEDKELKYLSKYNSIRALRIQFDSSSFLKPKYLHHLRYLDLSGSYYITALPEDISILYHLQTLNISDCHNLAQLPKQMKYMTGLRHLYTHDCPELKMMPPELRCLTSLQTLTFFVAGTPDSSCSKLGELGPLDNLGGELEVCQLENVDETEAEAANLGKKKELTVLTLSWSDPNEEAEHHDKVLEQLKPHDGIKVISIYSYGGSTYPTWMRTLHDVVELRLTSCKKIEKLPPLWHLPALQVLHISQMENLQCLCSGDPPFTFKKLKEITLDWIPNLEAWWDDIVDVQVQEPIFPNVEKLSISECEKLTALPRASSITESACPKLKRLELDCLRAFQRWQAAEGIPVEHRTTFPSLEYLSIKDCPTPTTLPEAPKLNELRIYEGNPKIWMHAARFIPSISTLGFSLRGIRLLQDHSLTELLDNKKKWSDVYSPLRHIYFGQCDFLFPQSGAPALWNCFGQLQSLVIGDCYALVHWPENVFRHLELLRELRIQECKEFTGCTQQASEQPERSVLPSRLESLELLTCCCLVDFCTLLPASLRELAIRYCDKLESVILRKQQRDATTTRLGSGDEVLTMQEKSTMMDPGSSRFSIKLRMCRNLQSLSVHLDCTELDIENCGTLKSLGNDFPLSLESLKLRYCESLVDVPTLPASLRTLRIRNCDKIESVIFCKQHDSTTGSSTAVPNLRCPHSAAPQLPSLSPSITKLSIRLSLEALVLYGCKSLESISDGSQTYSSLRNLKIESCPRLKVLPPHLKQRLNDIEKTYLDACYTGPKLSRPSTWKYAISRHC